MVRLTSAGLPRRFLTRHNDSQSIEVGNDTSIHGLIKSEQACLMRQELADGDLSLAVLREFRPIYACLFFVVKPAPGVSDGESHRGQTLGG